MFDIVTSGFETARDKLRGRTKITQESISEALDKVQKSMLEADVEYEVVNHFLAQIKERILESKINLRAFNAKRKIKVNLSDYFYNVCYDSLVNLLGKKAYELKFPKTISSIMLVGLQGVGKTTTAAKLAKHLKDKKKQPLLVACDIYRPAAVEQLKTLGEELGIPVFHKEDTSPLEIAKQAMTYAQENQCNLLILDTAGRLTLDEELMNEIKEIKTAIKPAHSFLVVDAMMGQDAVKTAKNFDEAVDVDAFILTKTDGDARAGAALSITYVTKKPIAFMGSGETTDALEPFRPQGMGSRILGMGDMLGLAEEFEELNSEEHSEEQLQKIMRYGTDYNDIMKFTKIYKKIASLRKLKTKLPSVLKEQLNDNNIAHMQSMHYAIQSMTSRERSMEVAINNSRIKRIAKGSGVSVQMINYFVDRMTKLSDQSKGQAQYKMLLKSFAEQNHIPITTLNDPLNDLQESADKQPTDTKTLKAKKESQKNQDLKRKQARKAKRKSSKRNRKKK